MGQSVALQTTNNKQAAISPDDHLILIPPPLQPLLPSCLLNLCQGTMAYFKFLQHLVGGHWQVGGKRRTSSGQAQVSFEVRV
jgi:hypothetical protein